MKIAIMQPYFFPYPKYYELASKVDVWVFLDNVNFQKKGFIHRNYINHKSLTQQINLRLIKSSQNKLINEIIISDKLTDTLPTIRRFYHKAPCYSPCYDFLSDLMEDNTDLLSDYLIKLNKAVFMILNIKPKIMIASRDFQAIKSSGEERILDIITEIQASEYYNLPGGKGLYDKKKFISRSCKLNFLDEVQVRYQRAENPFVERLSIIDYLMYNFGRSLFLPLKDQTAQ